MSFDHTILMQQYRPLTSNNTLFLDRDGVLLHTVDREGYRGSVRHRDEVKLTPLCQWLNAKDWNFVMITNQPDLSKGLIDMPFLQRVNTYISENIPLNMVLICPHQEEDHCNCRKPKTGLIDEFRKIYRLEGKEYMIGDTWRDKECAVAAGIPFVLLEGL